MQLPVPATGTAFFRLSLTLAIVWLVGSLGWGLWSGAYVRASQQAFDDRQIAECFDRFSADPQFSGRDPELLRATCWAGSVVEHSEWQRFRQGAPIVLAVRMFFGPPILILLIGAYGGWALSSIRGLGGRYRRWLVGAGR